MGDEVEPREAPELMMLGERLRELRSGRQWTLEELAERSGLSKPFLSRLESGTRQPSIAAVLTLARVFDVPMGSLFEVRHEEDPCIIIRAKSAAAREGNGISYVPLSGASRFFNVQPVRIVVSPQRPGAERYQHDGEEWIYVLTGSLKLRVGEKNYDLEPGDAAHFDSRLPHRLDASGGKDAEVILVACTIPTSLNTRRESAEMRAELVG
jgi:transcriptional regulator with XRE-family HTH domain